MFGFAWSIVNTWVAISGILIVGIASGGPPVVLYGWIGTCVLALCVAYAFAEMCSAYPISGGQYSWVAILSPPKYSRPLSYVTGWFMNAGLTGLCAACNYLVATFTLGIANLNYPSYTIQRWHSVLIAYLSALLAATFNIYLSSYLPLINRVNLYWNLAGFVIITITILACNDHKQSAQFVFVDFENETGFESNGMAVMVGLIQCFWSMCCFDGPSKMTEEMREPTKDAPKSIILSVWMGSVTGFVFLVSLFFCVGDIQATANTPTGVPLIQIMYDSTGSVAAATVLTSMIVVTIIVSTLSVTAESSRGLWAFARDGGLPCSTTLAKVSTSAIPRNAILTSLGSQLVLNSIYFGSAEGFSTILTFGTFGFWMSYAMALSARLLSYYTARVMIIPGPYSLGKWSPWIHTVGLLFTVLAAVDLLFPFVGPVTYDNMNYCSAAAGILAIFSGMTWFISGKKNFTGPETRAIDAVMLQEPVTLHMNRVVEFEKTTPTTATQEVA